MNTVRLPRLLVDQLLQLAQKSPDEEICGLISRDSDGFRQCYPVPNQAGDKKHFFTLDPKAQIDAMRSMREHGEELAAIFHSHPDSPAFPSPADVAQHEYPDVLYLIISLSARNSPALRGFHVQGPAIEEVTIGVQEEPAR